MTKKSSRTSKKNSSSFWQWVWVALAAFGLYKGLNYLLTEEKKPSSRPPTPSKVVALAPEKTEPIPTPPPVSPGPVAKWDFRETARLLPEGSFPDNYQPIPLKGNELGLLAYAKLIPGKTPGPKGLTHTRPGLRWYRLEGGNYQSQDLDFSKLNPVLGASRVQTLTGLPQMEKTPLLGGDKSLFLSRLFRGDDPMEAIAVVEADGNGIRWASLLGPDGKTQPAAFLKGTTRLSTRDFSSQTHQGKTYLIEEQGTLNESRLYEGYQWKVSAYYWDGNRFVYDKEYSEKLRGVKGK